MPEENNLNKEIDPERVTLCPDGKYRWVYELPMLRSPVILYTLWKVFAIAAFFPALVGLIAGLYDGDGLKAFVAFIEIFGGTFAIVFVLSFIGYFIVAAVNGWKYVVIFTMDENGVVHAQQEKQVKKAEAMGWITAMVGAAAGNLTTMGAGLLSASHSETVSDFGVVKSVSGHRRHNMIKVNQLFAKNQIYVQPDDYDFVYDFITKRCPKARIS